MNERLPSALDSGYCTRGIQGGNINVNKDSEGFENTNDAHWLMKM